MAIKNSKRFSEVEYCLQHYFNAQLSPIMRNVQNDLNKKQIKEYAEYQTSFAGMLRSASNTMAGRMDDSYEFVKLTGKWNSKTTEDYVEMCRKNIASNKDLQKDFSKMAAEWRNAVVAEIGRDKYDTLSKKLGGDLAFAYVDYRVEQMMVDHLVAQKVPKSSMEYIVRKAGEGSLLGLSSVLSRTPLDREIADRCEKAYNPSKMEKGAAKVGSFASDTLITGGFCSWASLGKLAAFEVAFAGAEYYLDSKNKGQKVMTVEDCISRGVFGSQKNVFTGFRQNSKKINSWENDYIKNFDKSLNKRMGIATTKPFYIDALKPPKAIQFPLMPSKERKAEYASVPMVIAPGHEEEYLANKKKLDMQVKAEAEAKAKAETEAKKQKEMDTNSSTSQTDTQEKTKQETTETEHSEQASENNINGWDGMLKSIGLGNLGGIGHNLGYVLAMLPDILIGLFTGKTKNMNFKNGVMPLASVMAGMFVKNPLLKMTLMGFGGMKLLDTAGGEILERKSESPQRQVQYKTYAEEALNPRIQNPTLQGNCLVANIDKVPCTIRLTDKVVDAYNAGALPLNTLANAILAKNDQSQMIAQNNYSQEQYRTESENRERSVGIK